MTHATIDPVPSKVQYMPVAKAPVPVKKTKMKFFMVAIAMATILNFLLVMIGFVQHCFTSKHVQ